MREEINNKPYNAITTHLKEKFDEQVKKANSSLSKVIYAMAHLKEQAELIHQYSGDTTALKIYDMACETMKKTFNMLPTISHEK